MLSLFPSTSTRKRTSYLKLDANEWQVESTCIELERVWKLEMHVGKDPKINWELGSKAIKKALKSIKERDDKEKNIIQPED